MQGLKPDLIPADSILLDCYEYNNISDGCGSSFHIHDYTISRYWI